MLNSRTGETRFMDTARLAAWAIAQLGATANAKLGATAAAESPSKDEDSK